MATRARDILIRFLGDDKNLSKVTKNVADETGKIAKGFDAVSTAVKGLVAAGAIRVLQGMAEAAAAEATEQTKLATVLRNTTNATDAQIASVERWVTSMQMATNVADTELRQALQSLTVAGMSSAEAQDAISVAIDIAAAKGIELSSVVNSLVKAQLGSLTGLQRLGIATKNAAGETLTFDQILQGAAETTGGTARKAAFDLAGQLEAVDVAFGELQESAGGSGLARAWARLKEGGLLAAEALVDLNNELPQARTLLNELVRQGVDPFTDRVPAMIAVLSELSRAGWMELTDSVEFLQAALGSTTQDMIEARAGIITYGEAWGYSAEQIAAMRGALEQSIGQFDPAVLATNRFQASLGELGAAAGEAEDDIVSLQDSVKGLFNPIRQARKAQEDWEDAARRQAQALASGKGDTEAASEAGLDLAEAYVDMNVAANNLDSTGILSFMQGIASQAGIAQDAIAGLKIELGNLSLIGPVNIPINVPINVTGSSSSSGSSQTKPITGSVRNLVENN